MFQSKEILYFTIYPSGFLFLKSWILKKQERTEWELRVLSVEQLRERVRYVCQSTILSGRNWASIIIRKERNPSRARTFRVSSWVSIDSLRLPNGRLYNLGSSRPCVCGEVESFQYENRWYPKGQKLQLGIWWTTVMSHKALVDWLTQMFGYFT
jgi:hypothetical protein